MMQTNKFIFYGDWSDLKNDLTEDEYKDFLVAVVDYGIYGIDNPKASIRQAYLLAKRQIDRDRSKYTSKCEKLRANASKSKQKQAKGSNCYQMLPNATNCKQNEQIGSNNNNIDNDIDIDNNPNNRIINNNNNTTCAREDFLEQFFSPLNQGNLQIFVEQLHQLNSDIALISDLRPYVDEVMARWGISNKLHYDYTDWASHMLDSIRKIVTTRTKQKKDQSQNNGLDLYAEQQRRILNEQLARNGTNIRSGDG